MIDHTMAYWCHETGFACYPSTDSLALCLVAYIAQARQVKMLMVAPISELAYADGACDPDILHCCL